MELLIKVLFCFSKYTKVENSIMNPHVPIAWLQELWTLGLSHFINQVLLFDPWGPPKWCGSSSCFLEERREIGRSGNRGAKYLPSWKSVNCHRLESPLMVHYSAGY